MRPRHFFQRLVGVRGNGPLISAADNQNWISGDVMRNGNMAAEARHTIHTLF